MITFYSRADGIHYWKSDFPASLRPFLNYEFYLGSVEAYNSFERKYKNYIKKNLPNGYTLQDFRKHYFEFSAVIKTPENKFIYISIPDVRYWYNEWATDILIRTMEHEKDWHGGRNQYTSLPNLMNKLTEIY